MTSIDVEVAGLRAGLIEGVAELAQTLVVDPSMNAQGAKAQKAVGVLRDFLAAYEASVRAFNSSSSEAYAFKDLSGPEREQYDRAKHLIAVLGVLHGPLGPS